MALNTASNNQCRRRPSRQVVRLQSRWLVRAQWGIEGDVLPHQIDADGVIAKDAEHLVFFLVFKNSTVCFRASRVGFIK